MDAAMYEACLTTLRRELVPAMGCTEPISVAYAAALAARALGCRPQRVALRVSGNIIKNVKSVIVPNTGGLHGLEAAAAAGIVAGDADAELLVIAQVSEAQKQEIRAFLQQVQITVEQAQGDCVFDITVELGAGGHTAICRIAGGHTRVVHLACDDEILRHSEPPEPAQQAADPGDGLTVAGIVAFADAVELQQVAPLLQRQIDCNMAIAQEGLNHPWGARIGQVMLAAYGDSVANRAKAWAAAGSDARMSGCELPVVINSGSGNQGITVSVPVVVYARELGVPQEKLYRALVISNLVAIHVKSGIGSLSAYCGATSAGCGAGAGITYLYGGGLTEIAHTIVNALAIDSGMICDGAKPSCAAKIVSAIEAGLLGMQMYRQGSEFYGGDGIVKKGVENTIRSVGHLARDGMRGTDAEIIRIMLGRTEC